MRLRIITVLVFVALSGSCTERGAQFRPDSWLSAAEEQSIVQQTQFYGWRPLYAASWTRGSLKARVCLADSGISGLSSCDYAFVFGPDGHLLEANILDSTCTCGPKTVIEIMPLRIEYQTKDGRSKSVTGTYRRGEGIAEIRKSMAASEERIKIVREWMASGDTNKEHLSQMIDRARTNRKQ